MSSPKSESLKRSLSSNLKCLQQPKISARRPFSQISDLLSPTWFGGYPPDHDVQFLKIHNLLSQRTISEWPQTPNTCSFVQLKLLTLRNANTMTLCHQYINRKNFKISNNHKQNNLDLSAEARYLANTKWLEKEFHPLLWARASLKSTSLEPNRSPSKSICANSV